MSVLLFAACSEGNGQTGGNGNNSGQTVITGNLNNCFADSIRLWEIVGPKVRHISAGKMEKSGEVNTFTISIDLPHSGFYMLGDDPRRAITVLLDGPGNFEMSGNCQNPQSYKLANSASNDTYQSMVQRIMGHNQRVQQLMQNMQIFQMSDPNQIPRIQADLKKENDSYFRWLDSLQNSEGIISKVAAIYNFPPFMSDPGHSKYENEFEYFRAEFFNGVDLKDAEVQGMPQIFEKARAYSGTLAGRGFPREALKTSFDELLSRAEPGSDAEGSLLKGLLSGLEQTKNDLYIDYGEAFLKKFPNDAPFTNNVQATIDRLKRFAIGAPAPDFTQPNPDGKSISLSDFRGNYVLIDFWASWCRPCRMENPNVLKAYNKYHGSGFEILGVSLDKEKGKWVQAIAQDGLTWKHVSDLRGWSSAPAKTYGVSSIPATVLVDKDGNIAARDLRGPALEKKLEEIYGF